MSSNKLNNSLLEATQSTNFLDLPRELRDSIYRDALISGPDPQYQAIEEAVMNGDEEYSIVFNRFWALQQVRSRSEVGLNFGETLAKRDIALRQEVDVLGADASSQVTDDQTHRIQEGEDTTVLSMLQGIDNPQIKDEAAQMYLRENTFAIYVDGSPSEVFCVCADKRRPEDADGFPCKGLAEYFKFIQHFHIVVNVDEGLDDPSLQAQAERAFATLLRVCASFVIKGNRIKTVRVTFLTCLGGEVEAMRHGLEGWASGPNYGPVLFLDKHGNNVSVKRGTNDEKLWRLKRVLEPLKLWTDMVEKEVEIVGDAPTAYMRGLEKRLLMKDPPAVAREARKKLEEKKKKLETTWEGKNESIDFKSHAKAMVEEGLRTGDPKKLSYMRHLKGPVVAPSVSVRGAKMIGNVLQNGSPGP